MNAAERILPIKTAFTGVCCVHCMAMADNNINLVKCSACKRAHYCNRTCQKADWKKHKEECNLMQQFRTLYPTLPGDSFVTKARYAMMTSILDEKSVTRFRQFMQFARVCAVCQKSEYDYDDVTKCEWTSCPTCHYGWCCSKEHWEQHKKDNHTTEVCSQFSKSILISRFEWNHAKKYNDTFSFVPNEEWPDTIRTESMRTFPKNWNDYFEVRCNDILEHAKTGGLPPEFLSAATRELSQPATCLYAMYAHGMVHLDDDKKMKTLTIHVVGASANNEVPATCVWEEIIHCLPSVKELTTVFVGPEACACLKGEHMLDIFDLECCNICTSQKRKRIVGMYGMTYHEFYGSDKFSKPDLIVAFNTGMHEMDVESWKMSLDVILKNLDDVPALFTSYNKIEADQDYEMLKNMNANTLTDGPVLNPVPVAKPEIDSSIATGDAFFRVNMYCIGFKGRND